MVTFLGLSALCGVLSLRLYRDAGEMRQWTIPPDTPVRDRRLYVVMLVRLYAGVVALGGLAVTFAFPLISR